MGDAVTFDIDPQTTAAFSSLMKATEVELGKSAPNTVAFAARKFVRSAIAATPVARKGGVRWVYLPKLTRAMRDGLELVGKIAPGQTWAKAKDIGFSQWRTRGRYFAKSGWVKGARRFGGKRVPKTGRGSYAFSDLVDRRKASVPYVEIADQVPYIAELDAGTNPNRRPFALQTPQRILNTAFIKTANQLSWYLEKQARAAAARWR
jgi:hypothetical protein